MEGWRGSGGGGLGKNFGRTTTLWLRAVGVETPERLAELGPARAYALLRRAGFNATLNFVWAAEGLLTGRDWRDIGEARKAELRAEAARALREAEAAGGPGAGAEPEG